MRLFGLFRQAVKGAKMVAADPVTAASLVSPRKSPLALSPEFYLTVLGCTARLPALSQLANPGAVGGAVEGLPVPLNRNATKDALDQPIERGAYAIASKNKKTLLSMIVMHPEEAGYDPTPVMNSPLAAAMHPDLLLRLRSTWHLVQFSFKTYDPAVYPALDLLLDVATRLATLSEGAIADPLAQRYLLPNELKMHPRAAPLADAREHIAVHRIPSGSKVRVFTKGMAKFALPELEMQDVRQERSFQAEAVLMSLAQEALLGSPIAEGDSVSVGGKGKLTAYPGGQDRGLWEGIAVLELLPERGDINDHLVGG